MDLALQRAERALSSSPSDPETYARWVGEWLRSGGRDPRRDPRAGDVVAQPSGVWHDPTSGDPLPIMREVLRVWPLALLRPLLLEPATGAIRRTSFARSADELGPWAMPGAIVRECSAADLSGAPRWRLRLRLASDAEWLDAWSSTEPDLGGEPPPGSEVLDVEWTHVGPTAPRQRARKLSTPGTWRRWARGGTVLRVAR